MATGFSMLGADVAIRGDISASADLHIDGRVEGDIACAALVQGEASEITGAIAAASARLAGTVRGSISVSQLTIQKSARIHGDVHYDQLTIEQGAQVEGRFAQREPAKELPGKGAVPLLAAD
ncbi:MAG TPA: polymer-forming cytoskeletal protein [Novosphingobium sp.]|nr:polymer-forming cytoskeletal protein [Novosphingobium sp.]